MPGSPLGEQSRERGKAPAGCFLSSLQLLWVYPEGSGDEGNSAIWQLQQDREAGHQCGLFSSGKGAGELKLLKMNQAAHEIHNRWRFCPLALQLSALFLPDYDFKQQWGSRRQCLHCLVEGKGQRIIEIH